MRQLTEDGDLVIADPLYKLPMRQLTRDPRPSTRPRFYKLPMRQLTTSLQALIVCDFL